MGNHKGWIGVDLDGTLAMYDGWKGENHIGDPVVEMVARVQRWINDGIEVRIFTARVSNDPSGKIAKLIEDWCLENIGEVIPVTNAKDYGMYELWDDRAVQVIPNTGQRADGNASN